MKNLLKDPRAGLFWIFLAVSLAATSPAQSGPEALADEVFYHFMPIAWRDSDQDAARLGDFDGMTASLSYLDSLGITAIWMNPIFPSNAYHGYQHGAADQVDPRFGNLAQFRNFVQSAHSLGIQVYVDLVAYGISQDEVWFTDSYGNPSSVYDDWLAYDNAANTQFLGSNYTTWDGSSVGFIHWDLRNPSVSAMVRGWAQFWLDPNGDGDLSDGLDGFRLDHVWEFYPYGPGGWGYNMSDFWVPFQVAVQEVNPDALLLAEQADWGTFGTQLFAGVDASFTKPFEFAARDALIQENASGVYASLAATVAAANGATEPGTFLATIGNHDVSRLATVIGDNFEKGKVAAALLLTQPFAPVLYFGDEIGMRGAKDNALGGDASDIPMREPFKWNAVDSFPMGRYHQLNVSAWNARIARDHDGRSVEEQEGVAGSLLEAYRELIGLRKARVSLRRGSFAAVPATQSAVLAFARLEATQQSLVVMNLSGAPLSFSVDLSGFAIPGSGVTVPAPQLGSAVMAPLSGANASSYPMNLSAYGYEVFDLNLEALPPSPDAIDGRMFHGAGLGLQSASVSAGDDNGFELDQLFARVEAGRLILSASGNLDSGFGGLCVFYDVNSGGQNVLNVSGIFPPPSGPENLSGTRFDSGFHPEGFLYVNDYQNQVFVDHFFLADGGGASKTYRGMGLAGSGSGALTGGVNPNGIEVALDNSNAGGVTPTGVSGAGAVTTGVEMSIPLVDLGATGAESSLRIALALLRFDGSFTNQWLPSLGPGASDPGIAPDLRSVAGANFATIDLSVTTASPTASSDFVLRAYPFSGSIVLEYTMPTAGQVELAIYDLRGRRVRRWAEQRQAAGVQRQTWDRRDERGHTVVSGVYLVELRAAGASRTTKVVLGP